MKTFAFLALCAGVAVACQDGNKQNGDAGASSGGSGFSDPGVAEPPPTTITAQNGTTYLGKASLVILYDGTKSELQFYIFAGRADDGGVYRWNAQLYPTADSVAAGVAPLTIKPYSFAAGTGFVKDGNEPDPRMLSGTATLNFVGGKRFIGEARLGDDAFTAHLDGSFTLGCFVPPAMVQTPPTANSAGTPTGGAVQLVEDKELTTPFCHAFARLR